MSYQPEQDITSAAIAQQDHAVGFLGRIRAIGENRIALGAAVLTTGLVLTACGATSAESPDGSTKAPASQSETGGTPTPNSTSSTGAGEQGNGNATTGNSQSSSTSTTSPSHESSATPTQTSPESMSGKEVMSGVTLTWGGQLNTKFATPDKRSSGLEKELEVKASSSLTPGQALYRLYDTLGQALNYPTGIKADDMTNTYDSDSTNFESDMASVAQIYARALAGEPETWTPGVAAVMANLTTNIDQVALQSLNKGVYGGVTLSDAEKAAETTIKFSTTFGECTTTPTTIRCAINASYMDAFGERRDFSKPGAITAAELKDGVWRLVNPDE